MKEEHTLKINLDEKGLQLLSSKLKEVYGNDIEVYHNMSIYTDEWSTIISENELDNGFTGENIEEWVNNLFSKLKDEKTELLVFFDHIKYDDDESQIKKLTVFIKQ